MISKITLTNQQTKQLLKQAAVMDKTIGGYSREMYNNIFVSFFLSSLLSYITILYILPYILDFSFLLSAFLLGAVLGVNFIIAISLIVKMFLQVLSLAKGNGIGTQLLNAKNTVLFTQSRFS